MTARNKVRIGFPFGCFAALTQGIDQVGNSQHFTACASRSRLNVLGPAYNRFVENANLRTESPTLDTGFALT